MKLGLKAVGILLAGIVLGSVGSVAAQTATPVPESGDVAPAPVPGDKVRHRFHFAGPKGAMRSTAVLPGEDGGEVRTVRTDRGELTEIDGQTLVVTEEDGAVVRIPVGEDTKIHRDGENAELADLQAGDTIMSIREKTGEAEFETRGVRALSQERAAEMEAKRRECEENPAECPLRGPGRFHRKAGPMGHMERAAEPAETAFFLDAA